MCIQWTRALYSVVITRQSNPPISQFNNPCNEFTDVWSMFVHTTCFSLLVVVVVVVLDYDVMMICWSTTSHVTASLV